MTTPADLIAPNEAARMFSVSVSTLASWRRAGRIKYWKLSDQKILYSKEWIEKFISDHAIEATNSNGTS